MHVCVCVCLSVCLSKLEYRRHRVNGTWPLPVSCLCNTRTDNRVGEKLAVDKRRWLCVSNYAIWGVLENKTNATFHPSIGWLKTAIEKEWNRMSEEFILKTCESFRRRVATISEKTWRSYFGKFTVLYLSSYFEVYFNDHININLFYIYV